MDLLFSMRDLGIPDPLPDSVDVAVRVALTRAIHSGVNARTRRFRSLRRLLRHGPLIPVALVMTTAVAAAATGVATGIVPLPSMLEFAHHNASDPALRLFQKSVPYQGGTVTGIRDGKATIVPYEETVIPSSVRMIATPTVPGVGTVEFWVGDTRQHGYCVALRLPGGSWAGLEDFKQVGGTIPGCQPTRRQVGWGALIISGFDYTDAEVLTSSGKELVLDYGQIVAPGHPTKVRDRHSGASGSVIDGKYFLIVTHPVRTKNGGYDVGDYTHLVALDASGKIVADEKRPLPGTPG